jgi:membrane protease YdiL (CAAX protease family)
MTPFTHEANISTSGTSPGLAMVPRWEGAFLYHIQKRTLALDLAREMLLNLEVYLALALAAAAGVLYLQRSAGRWFPLPRLRRGRWSGGEVFLCFLLFLLVPHLVVFGLDEAGFFFLIFQEHVRPTRNVLVVAPLTLTLLFALFFTLLYQISRTYPTHVGLTPARWRANVRLGLAAFCLATPLVLGFNYLVLQVTARSPHELETLAKHSLRDFEWVLLACNAVLAVPLMEEWLFRGLLQGWLRRASPLGHLVVAMFALVAGSGPLFQSLARQKTPADPILWESLAFTTILVAIYIAGVLRLWWPVFQNGLHHFHEIPAGDDSALPVEPLEGQTPVVLPQGPRWEAFKLANARWSIFGSAMLFALVHEAWPSPVALLPFGLVVGWLAYRTQSLVPGIVLHALFNAIAVAVLYWSTVAPPNGNEQTTAWRPAKTGSTVSVVPGSWWPRLK